MCVCVCVCVCVCPSLFLLVFVMYMGMVASEVCGILCNDCCCHILMAFVSLLMRKLE